jgi:uracil-DNA glycosylase
VTGDSLEGVAAEVRSCPRCRLALTRTNAVPGAGKSDADLLLVGEAPGRTEDELGLPFQGLSGRFLNQSLAGLGLSRDDVFVSSVNKCRPPQNRNPRRDEIAACAPYLDRQMALIKPLVVLAMGGTAAARLHPETAGVTVKVADLRGQVIPVAPDRALLVTYHPAAALRFPKQRRPFLDDLERAARLACLLP